VSTVLVVIIACACVKCLQCLLFEAIDWSVS